MQTKMIVAGASVVGLILLLRLDPSVLALLLGVGLGVMLCVGAAVLACFFATDAPQADHIPTLAEELAECDRKQAARQAQWQAAQQ